MGWKDAPEVGGWASAPEVVPEQGSRARAAAQSDGLLTKALMNLVPGAIRGAGGIGATLRTPVVAFDSDGNIDPRSYFERRRENVQAQDAALQSLGADPSNPGFKLGKLTGEIAGTAGAGGATANALARIPGVASAAPNLLRAIETAGMRGGNALTRAAGGAVSGGVSAGLVNPEDAGAGALIGGVLPGVAQAAGTIGQKIGSTFRGPVQSPELAAAIQKARDAGYVIPPTQANPTLANRVLEGFSGKITTAQNASAKNAAVTSAKAAEAIGLPADTALSPQVLDAVRAEAGKAYAAVSKLGKFDATRANLPASVQVEESISPLLAGKVKSVDAAEVVRSWRQANADATAYYRAYARDANPETLAKAKAAASDAKKIDDFMMSQVPSDLGKELKDARVLIAKTHSVEAAMNPATGAIDARKLAKQLEKGKPLSGGLKDAAEFAGRFPKAAQPVESMGSLPQISPLDFSLGGILSAATANPLMLASVAARPAARSVILSPVVQDRLVQSQGGNALSRLLSPELAQLGYRAAPVVLSDR